MSAATYPILGVCGACTRPARQFPSGRWEHTGRPCQLRSGGGLIGPFTSLPPAVFVAAGEPLPQPERGGRWVPYGDNLGSGVPSALGWVPAEQDAAGWDRVRAELAAEAERGEGA